MSRRVTTLCISVSMLAGLGLATSGLGPSATATGAVGHVPAATPQSHALIQGLVADGTTGRYLDDVDVRAVEADGVIAASGFTYASLRADGPQHGYYYLHARPGTYDVEVRADGYQRTVVEDVTVVRNRRTTLDDIELEKVESATRTKLSAKNARLTTKRPGALTVAVTSPATKRPVGVVVVKEGRRTVKRVHLAAGSRGVARVSLGRLRAGRHVYTASFAGGPGLKDSTSRPTAIRVTQARSGGKGHR